MRFNISNPPQNGDTRTRYKFCFFPTRVTNEIVWLEFIHVEEVFLHDYVNYDAFECECWTVMAEL